MTREEINAVIARRVEVWPRRNPAELASLYTDDAVVESPSAGTVQGRVAIEHSYRAWLEAFPDLEYAQDQVLIDGGRVAVGFRLTGTHQAEFLGVAATGKRFEIRGVLVVTLDGQKIAHERRVYDFAGFLLKVGILKARPV